MGQLSEAEFSAWFADWQRACTALSDREERMGAVAERIEAGLTVVGATAIEDKLQVRGKGRAGGGRGEAGRQADRQREAEEREGGGGGG